MSVCLSARSGGDAVADGKEGDGSGGEHHDAVDECQV